MLTMCLISASRILHKRVDAVLIIEGVEAMSRREGLSLG